MINAIDPEALMRIIPKNLPGFYEVTRLDDGDIIIKKRTPREKALVEDGKAKNGPGSSDRLTN